MAWISRYGLPSVPNVRAFFIIMNALQVFSYKGSNVTFSNENGMWVNATEMAKKFEKKPYEWLRLQSTKDFLLSLLNLRGFNVADSEFNIGDSPTLTLDSTVLTSIGLGNFVRIENGKYGGTWFHEDVAIEFARWLSPLFAIWCNERIKEILTGTMAKYPMSSDEAIAYGYGKALEKISRQSTIIKKQGKRITALLGKLESEKEAKQMRLLEAKMNHTEIVKEWLDHNEIHGCRSLANLSVRFSDYCMANGVPYVSNKALSSSLRKLGYPNVRKAKGTCFVF